MCNIFTEHLILTRKLLTSQLILRQELLEKSKEVVQINKINEQLQLENQELSHELNRVNKKKSQLLKKFKYTRVKTEKIEECSKKGSQVVLRKIWIKPTICKLVLVIFVSILALLIDVIFYKKCMQS